MVSEGQRVICAHWKRVICTHCKRVIPAQRNRVIRAQRAVIRAHWCWEPAISWGGVGWDDNVHVPMHTQAQQPHHLSCCWEETGTALSWSVTGGVGWVNKVHVPMPAHAQQPHHLSCCRALTRTALSWSVTLGGGGGGGGGGGVGWGGMITFMFLCTHRHSNLIIFLPVEQRQAQLFHDQLPVGWGELIRFMFLCLHTHSNLIIFLAVEHLHLWDERSCVKWVVLVVRWAEIREMSCVSCEMSGVVWDEWSSVRWVVWVVRWVVWKNLGEVQWENTKQLHQMPHESSSWESWVVWDELSEMSCVRWVVWLVRWEELCEMKCVHCVRQLEWSWERKKQLREKEEKARNTNIKTKAPHRDVRKKTITWWVVWWC